MTHSVLRSEALGGLKASPGPGTSHVPAGTNRALRRSYGNGAVDEILCVSRGVAAGGCLQPWAAQCVAGPAAGRVMLWAGSGCCLVPQSAFAPPNPLLLWVCWVSSSWRPASQQQPICLMVFLWKMSHYSFGKLVLVPINTCAPACCCCAGGPWARGPPCDNWTLVLVLAV